MVMTNEQAAALVAAAQEAASNGGDVPTELRCQYPSKRCDHVRTLKRGGGLHRLCSFHRQRANKNQWLVDQRRRIRREREGSLMRRGAPMSQSVAYGMVLQPAVLHALDVLDADASCPELCDEDLHILQALLFDEEDDELCDYDLPEDFGINASMEWTI